MTDISPDRALLEGTLQDLAKQIAEDEAKLWNDVQRLQARIRDIEREIYDLKHEHLLRVRPLRQQHEAIATQIARAAYLSTGPVVLIPIKQDKP